MKEKILALIYTLGSVFAGKRGDGIYFGWTGIDSLEEKSTWSWAYPYHDFNVKVGISLQFPLLGLMRVYVHKESNQLRTYFKGFTPKEMEVFDDKVTVKINDALIVTVMYHLTDDDLTFTVEHAQAGRLSLAYSSDPHLIAP